MRIKTSRFGEVEFQEDDLLEFKEGLLGFMQLRKFVILDDPNDEIFAWLQSCESPEIAFPILEPELFAPDISVTIPKSDIDALGLTSAEDARLFCIITIPVDPTQMTANMKAPLLINAPKRIARQCVLQDNNLAIREPVFSRLQQRVLNNPQAQVKPDTSDMGAIKLPEKSQGPGPEAEL